MQAGLQQQARQQTKLQERVSQTRKERMVGGYKLKAREV